MIEGRCLCGAVTITVADDGPGWVGACHCGMCQRWSGGLFLCFPAAPEAVTVSGPVKSYRSSRLSARAFCAECGSHLWMRDLEPDATYDLMPGLFEAALGWGLKSEIYTDRAMASVSLAGPHARATQAEYEAKNPRALGDVT